jgi:thiamine monophosphate kinase
MGAQPAWATLALTLPTAELAWIEGFSAAFSVFPRRISFCKVEMTSSAAKPCLVFTSTQGSRASVLIIYSI